MKLLVTFGNPRKVSENKPNYVILRFPFTTRRIGNGALRDVTSHHYVDVQISEILMTQWGFGSTRSHALRNSSFVKTLFKRALEEVELKLRSEEPAKHYAIDLHTGNSPQKNPYDPAAIPNPEGFSFEI